MLICIDIGNSNITIGVFEEETLKFTARLATDTRRTSDQYAIEIRDIIEIYGIELQDITDAAISSVVPTVGSAIEKAVDRLFGINPVVLGPGVKTGLNIKIDNPAQLGADLAAGAVGALAKYTTPTIIIDMGTASTISVLGKNGEFLGGVIAAGVKLTMDALAARTAQLPSVSIEAPKKTVGTNTVGFKERPCSFAILIETGWKSPKNLEQQKGCPQIPSPPIILASSLTPIWRNSIRVWN